MDFITLKTDDWDVLVSPQYGACILRCQYRSSDILKPGDASWKRLRDPVLTSYFPLVSFSNRIKDGIFTWDEEAVSLSPTHRNEKHPLHGFGWLAGGLGRHRSKPCAVHHVIST